MCRLIENHMVEILEGTASYDRIKTCRRSHHDFIKKLYECYPAKTTCELELAVYELELISETYDSLYDDYFYETMVA